MAIITRVCWPDATAFLPICHIEDSGLINYNSRHIFSVQLRSLGKLISMRKTTFLVLLAICIQIFCVPIQQSMAQGRGDVVSGDILDSDVFFRSVEARPKLRDHSAEIQALLKKMTLEEKVGQMTQLEI